MEQYVGVKFQYRQHAASFACDKELEPLNHWAWIFSELGLAPIHPEGAYGNFSCRTENSFLISKSGMTPSATLQPENYCLITACDEKTGTLTYQGTATPSSETFMHYLIYSSRPDVAAILHGHCALMLAKAQNLQLATTPVFYDYGTQDLASSAQKLAEKEDFFLLRNHGFLSLGKDLNTAGEKSISVLQRLLTLLP